MRSSKNRFSNRKADLPSERKDHLINQSINELVNDKGVYRTAPATPGLFIIYDEVFL